MQKFHIQIQWGVDQIVFDLAVRLQFLYLHTNDL